MQNNKEHVAKTFVAKKSFSSWILKNSMQIPRAPGRNVFSCWGSFPVEYAYQRRATTVHQQHWQKNPSSWICKNLLQTGSNMQANMIA